jgi:hypothetical protein
MAVHSLGGKAPFPQALSPNPILRIATAYALYAARWQPMDHRDADVSLTDHGLRWKHGKQAATAGKHACDFVDGWREVSDVFEDLIGYDYIGRIREGQSIVTNLSDRVAEESLVLESGHDRCAVLSF